MKPQMQFMSKVFRIWSLNLTPEISKLESLWFSRPRSGISHPPQPDSGYSNVDSVNDKSCVAGGERRRRKDGGTQTASQEDEASLIANASLQMLIAQSSGWVVLQDENGTTGKNSINEQFLRRRFLAGFVDEAGVGTCTIYVSQAEKGWCAVQNPWR